MHILQIDAGRDMRGGQWQVLRLLEGLRDAGVAAQLAARPDSPLAQRARERKLSVVPLDLAAVRLRPDLGHVHDSRSHTLAALLARAPIVVSRRVAFPIGTGPLSRWKYGRASHYIAVSGFVGQRLSGGGVPPRRISIVYDGVPLLPPTEAGSRILAPPPSPDKPAEMYQLPGVEVHFAENLEADLKTAAIFVYMSMSEGLGSAVLLAMSAAVPVIAARTGGIPEIIRHEHNGLLVDPQPASLAAAIRRLQGDPVLARTLGRNARQTVAETFSIDNMVQGTIRVYNQVLAC